MFMQKSLKIDQMLYNLNYHVKIDFHKRHHFLWTILTPAAGSKGEFFRYSKSKRFSSRVRVHGTTGGRDLPRTPAPDLPSMLLENRIVFLGMPLVPAVSELLVAQLLYLQFVKKKNPRLCTSTPRDVQGPMEKPLGLKQKAQQFTIQCNTCKMKSTLFV